MLNALDQQLFDAASGDDANQCLALIKKGANVCATDDSQHIALHFAAWSGHTQVCRLLIESGADIHTVDNWVRTTLHFAAMRGHIETCVVLLSCGANPLQPDKNEKTAQDLAIEEGYTNCANAISAWLCAQAARAALQEISASKTAPPGL